MEKLLCPAALLDGIQTSSSWRNIPAALNFFSSPLFEVDVFEVAEQSTKKLDEVLLLISEKRDFSDHAFRRSDGVVNVGPGLTQKLGR